jgi:Holliday junction resolvasome RuvABC endonuclease subunit
MDPSLRNWGLAIGTYDLASKQLQIDDLQIVQPVVETAKQVRQNSKDIHTANQLYSHVLPLLETADTIFVEVPIGSQSARAMASYGVCVGILGSIQHLHPFIEVTPTEVKLAGAGHKSASKQEMIQWAREKHPEAPWPTYLHKGSMVVSEAKAEHMADAVAAIYAGLNSKSFQQTLPLIAALRKTLCKSN